MADVINLELRLSHFEFIVINAFVRVIVRGFVEIYFGALGKRDDARH